MIQIRAFFKWREATPEQAFEFCNNFIKEIMVASNQEEKIAIINKSHLKGITYEELKKQVLRQTTIFDFIGDE